MLLSPMSSTKVKSLKIHHQLKFNKTNQTYKEHMAANCLKHLALRFRLLQKVYKFKVWLQTKIILNKKLQLIKIIRYYKELD